MPQLSDSDKEYYQALASIDNVEFNSLCILVRTSLDNTGLLLLQIFTQGIFACRRNL